LSEKVKDGRKKASGMKEQKSAVIPIEMMKRMHSSYVSLVDGQESGENCWKNANICARNSGGT
jgi:hypothetical protein